MKTSKHEYYKLTLMETGLATFCYVCGWAVGVVETLAGMLKAIWKKL
jgi:hypothetical protein